MTPRSDGYPAPLPAANPILWGGDQWPMISYDYGRTWLVPPQWPGDLPYCLFGPGQWDVGNSQGMVPWDLFSGWSEAITINRDNGRVYLVTLQGDEFGAGYRGMYGSLYVGFDFWGGNYGLDSTYDPTISGPLSHLGFPGNNVLIVGSNYGYVYRLVDSNTILNPPGDRETCVAPFATNLVLDVTSDPDFAGASWRLKLIESFIDGQFVIVYRMVSGGEIFKVYRSYDFGQSFSHTHTLPTHSGASGDGFGQLMRLNLTGMWAFFTGNQLGRSLLFVSDDDMDNWTRVADFSNDTFTFADGSSGGNYIADFSGYGGRVDFSHKNVSQIQNTFTLREYDDYTPVIRGCLNPSTNLQSAPLPGVGYNYGWVVDIELGRTTVTVDKIICDEAGFTIRAPHVNELRQKFLQLNSRVQTGGTNRVNFGIDVSDLPTVSAQKTAIRRDHYSICKRETDKVIGQVGTVPGSAYYCDVDLTEFSLLMPDPIVDDPVSIRTLIGMRKTLQSLYSDGFFCACYSYCPCQTHIDIDVSGGKK